MGYLVDSVNGSATVIAAAGAACAAPAMRAFAFDENGNLVLAGAGKHAMGLAIASAADVIGAGDPITVQVKDIGPAIAGGAFKKGAELAVGANGKLVAATTGAFILAVALENASGDGDVALTQIVKAGYK